MNYSSDMIEKTERTMLLHLEFQTNLPTPMDFLQFLLYLSNENYDFSSIIHDCLSFVYVSLIGTHILLGFSILNIRLRTVQV